MHSCFFNYNLECLCVNIHVFTLQNILMYGMFMYMYINYAFMLVKYFDKSSCIHVCVCSIKKFNDTKLLNDVEICNTLQLHDDN